MTDRWVKRGDKMLHCHSTQNVAYDCILIVQQLWQMGVLKWFIHSNHSNTHLRQLPLLSIFISSHHIVSVLSLSAFHHFISSTTYFFSTALFLMVWTDANMYLYVYMSTASQLIASVRFDRYEWSTSVGYKLRFTFILFFSANLQVKHWTTRNNLWLTWLVNFVFYSVRFGEKIFFVPSTCTIRVCFFIYFFSAFDFQSYHLLHRWVYFFFFICIFSRSWYTDYTTDRYRYS